MGEKRKSEILHFTFHSASKDKANQEEKGAETLNNLGNVRGEPPRLRTEVF